MKICTYYENIGFAKQDELVELWIKNWEQHGFEPIVLGKEHAEQHPYYEEFCTSIKTLHQQIMGHSIQEYGMSCWVRWLAYAGLSDNTPFYASDYDIFNNGFSIENIPEEQLHFMDYACPCFTSGTSEQFEKLCRVFVDISTQNLQQLQGSVDCIWYHDQELLLHNISDIKEVDFIKMTSEPNVGLYNHKSKKIFEVTHFAHQSIIQARNDFPYLERYDESKLRIKFIKQALGL